MARLKAWFTEHKSLGVAAIVFVVGLVVLLFLKAKAGGGSAKQQVFTPPSGGSTGGGGGDTTPSPPGVTPDQLNTALNNLQAADNASISQQIAAAIAAFSASIQNQFKQTGSNPIAAPDASAARQAALATTWYGQHIQSGRDNGPSEARNLYAFFFGGDEASKPSDSSLMSWAGGAYDNYIQKGLQPGKL